MCILKCDPAQTEDTSDLKGYEWPVFTAFESVSLLIPYHRQYGNDLWIIHK